MKHFYESILAKTDSVTRFGKIVPLRQMFTCLWQIFQGIFLIWQNAEPNLTNIGLIFIVANGQILKTNLNILSH